ncbi:MAG: hypothetical protein K9J42_04885 [Sulfuritalea sp.]|nr:hypothetical protein [Sulfuritalea sp.]
MTNTEHIAKGLRAINTAKDRNGADMGVWPRAAADALERQARNIEILAVSANDGREGILKCLAQLEPLREAAQQAVHCLRELAPNNAHAKATAQMLHDALIELKMIAAMPAKRSMASSNAEAQLVH